jgi:prepilin-type N-terminal cleavage/methylation domain-containing protein
MSEMRPPRSQQAGFTLLEVIVVLALISILAAIAIPTFFSESRRAKGAAEVQTIFNDLRTRMDTYMQETALYPPTIGESTLHPATPASTEQPLFPLPTAWTDAKIRITNAPDDNGDGVPETQVYCGYTWVTGAPNDVAAVGTEGAAFGFVPPVDVSWYYLLAKCDLDGDSTLDSFYFSSSVDPTVLKRNEGN